jgi:signal transduction histidine kinase
LSLRTKILVAVALVHAGAFLPLAWLVSSEAASQRRLLDAVREQQIRTLTRVVESTIARTEPRDVAELANWPFRDLVRTGLIVQRSAHRQAYNLARPRRPADLDVASAQTWIDRAIAEDRSIPVGESSYAVPIRAESGGAPWGGAFLVFEDRGALPDVAELSTGALLLSLVLVSALVHALLSWLVLRPIGALADGAARIAAGNYREKIAEPRSADEMSDLVRSFNSMMERVGNFSAELSREVERATQKALSAERQLQQARRLASTGRLAAGIAHEINNPLGGLMNATEALRTKELSPERKRTYLELIAEGLQRIQGIVGRVLQFSPRRAEPERFRLVGAFQRAVGLIEHRLEKEGVALETAELDERALVFGNEHELQQVFLNLLLNALDALQESPLPAGEKRIRVSIYLRGERACAEVADNGPGVEKALLPNLQELFFSTKEVGKGTGLGLSLCAGIVENHGGRLDLDSDRGAGFVARIDFPLASG